MVAPTFPCVTPQHFLMSVTHIFPHPASPTRNSTIPWLRIVIRNQATKCHEMDAGYLTTIKIYTCSDPIFRIVRHSVRVSRSQPVLLSYSDKAEGQAVTPF